MTKELKREKFLEHSTKMVMEATKEVGLIVNEYGQRLAVVREENYGAAVNALAQTILWLQGLGKREINRRLKELLSGKIIEIEVEGGRALVDLGDWTAARTIIERGWEAAIMRMCRHLIDPGDTVFDIGSHNGQYAILFASLVGEGGMVYAFEPFSANIALLKGTISLNDSQTNIVVEPLAMSDHVGETSLFCFDKSLDEAGERYPEASGMTTSLIRGPGYSEVSTHKVRTTTLDAYAAEKDIKAVDFVKIDTEGAELKILKGSRDVVSRSEHLSMMIELHLTELRSQGSSVQDVLDELLSMELVVIDLATRRAIRAQHEWRGGHLLATRREIG